MEITLEGEQRSCDGVSLTHAVVMLTPFYKIWNRK